MLGSVLRGTLVALLLLAAARTADACVWMGAGDDEVSICRSWSSPMIFTGRVTGIMTTGGASVTTFAVLESFRGVTTKTIDIIDAGSDCAVEFFRTGESYFVYASIDPKTDRVEAWKTLHTVPLRDARRDIARAEEGPRFDSIRGIVQTHDGKLPGVPITLTGAGKKLHVITDVGGHFRVEGLPYGQYIVHADLPPPFTPYKDQIIVVAEDSCETFAYFYALR